MERVAREVLRALRGPRSQVQLARRLGYSSNPVAEWEGGRRWPTAAEVLRICRLTGVDVEGSVARFHPQAAAAFGPAEAPQVGAWLAALHGDRSIADLARQVGQSRSTVSRWLAGHTAVRWPDFLEVVDAITGRLPDLVAEWVPIAAVPSLQARFEQGQHARRLLFDHPWATAILACLQTTRFAGAPTPSAAAVAEALGLDEAVVQRCLEALEVAGVWVHEGGRYRELPGRLIVDTLAIPGGPDRLRRHWAAVAMERLATRGPDDQYGYAVFSVSREDLERLRELHRAYYRQVRAIVAASAPTDVVAVLNLQLIELRGPPSAG